MAKAAKPEYPWEPWGEQVMGTVQAHTDLLQAPINRGHHIEHAYQMESHRWKLVPSPGTCIVTG